MKTTKGRLKEIIREELARIQVREAGDEAWDLYEHLLHELGPEALLEELMRAMSTGEAMANLEHIAQMHDLHRDHDEDMMQELHEPGELDIDMDDVEEIAMMAENDGDLYRAYQSGDLSMEELAYTAIRNWVKMKMEVIEDEAQHEPFVRAVVKRLEGGTTYDGEELDEQPEHGASGRDVEDPYRTFTGKHRKRGKSRGKERRAMHKRARQRGKKETEA